MRRLISSRPFRFLLALGVAAALDFGCSNSPSSPSTTPTGVTISPSRATVRIGGIQQFAALVSPVSPPGASQSVTWSVAGTGCSGASCGTIDATGKYTAPATVPNPATVTVTARSTVDSTKSAAATVTIVIDIPVESFSMNPTSVAFGNQTVNTTSAPRAVTLTNTGSTPQPVLVRINGGNFADFAQTNDCPSMIAVGASCTFNITFRPSAFGGRVAILEVDGTFDEEGVVNLTGMGTN
jgi:Bacterial Ig-like domain (group 2)